MEKQEDYIIQRIRQHLANSYYKYEEIVQLLSMVPDHVKYSGKAYRIICDKTCDEIDQSVNKNLYWSMTLDGLNNYKNNSYVNDTNDLLLEANVKGIVLKSLIDFCNSQTPEKVPLYNPYDKEEEILVYELDSFQKIN